MPNYNANIINEFTTKRYDFVQPINVYELQIQLIDYLANNIDLGGKDYSFSLILYQIKNSKIKKK